MVRNPAFVFRLGRAPFPVYHFIPGQGFLTNMSPTQQVAIHPLGGKTIEAKELEFWKMIILKIVMAIFMIVMMVMLTMMAVPESLSRANILQPWAGCSPDPPVR